MTYPSSNKPEDVWAARMNDNFKTNYALEMYCFGEYPGYYQVFNQMRHLSRNTARRSSNSESR